MPRPDLYLCAGGGTGGHIFPLFALSAIVRTQDALARFHYAGIAGRVDESVYPNAAAEERTMQFDLQKLASPVGIKKKIAYAFQTLLYAVRWRRFMHRNQPLLVVLSGGYACLPPLLAAYWTKTPVLVYEPNGVDGRVTKVAEKLSGFGVLAGVFRPLRDTSCLPLLRKSVLPTSSVVEKEGSTLIVLGGSQGSVSLNRMVSEHVEEIFEAGIEKILWVAGKIDAPELTAAFESDSRIKIFDFVHDISALLSQATVAVARAGASTIFELASWQVPTVYVPLPWAADDHQRKNAAAAVSRGWGTIVEEGEEQAFMPGLKELLDKDSTHFESVATSEAVSEYWSQQVRQAVSLRRGVSS